MKWFRGVVTPEVDHQTSFVEQLVSRGRRQNATEVRREGLRLVEMHEAEGMARVEALRTAVRVGIADIGAGRFETFDSASLLKKRLRAIAAKAIASA